MNVYKPPSDPRPALPAEPWKPRSPSSSPLVIVADPPPKPRLEYRPHQVLAIAATLAADFPGMFAGADVLRPIRAPEPERPRREPIVIDSLTGEVPPLEKRPGHRSGYRVGLTTKGGGKPPGSKLARKAARGKL